MVTEVQILPDNAVLYDGDWAHTHDWVLLVKWCGPRRQNGHGGWGVADNHSQWLSLEHTWGNPERNLRPEYRWETMDEAIAAAEAVVNDYAVKGYTFAGWAAKYGWDLVKWAILYGTPAPDSILAVSESAKQAEQERLAINKKKALSTKW